MCMLFSFLFIYILITILFYWFYHVTRISRRLNGASTFDVVLVAVACPGVMTGGHHKGQGRDFVCECGGANPGGILNSAEGAV